MKLLLVVAYFVPEIGSAAHIYFDLAKAFVRRGHEVHVITSYPRKFNLSRDDIEKDFPLEEIIDGIFVHRCKHTALRDNLLMRGVEHFLLPCSYFQAFRRIGMQFDACLIYIPPLPLYYFAQAIKKYNSTPSVLNYQDFHPQELIDIGLMKNKFLIMIMEYIEHQSYKNADYITVLSEGGIDYIVRRGRDRMKIKHIYNGFMISNLNTKPLAKKDFKKKEGIEGKILITYAGILSPFQGLDNILDAAKELRERDDLIFFLVGDGIIKDYIVHRIKDENLYNVRLLPLQPREEYFNLINSSDVSIVSLDERMKAPCIPGKLINLMAVRQPLIAIVPNESETAKIIRESKCGIVVRPGCAEELKQVLLQFTANRESLKVLGNNGEEFLKENMDLDKIVPIYEQIFNILAKSPL